MFSHIEQLKTALLAFSKTNSKASKAKKIRHLYSTLEHVINEGLSIDLIVDFLNQHGIQITKNNLKVTLYRIRKEKGLVKDKGTNYLIDNNSIINNSDVAIATVPIKTPYNITSLQEKEKRYHEIKRAISVAITWREKYIAMGGDHEKIKDMAESQILHMYTALQKKFVKEYKPFIKSN